jgi:RNA polymerase sigma-70 factor (ECF subfamily)
MASNGMDQADQAFAAERALIEAALVGDGLAFRRLVEPHLPMLHRIATRVSRSPHLAEDAVQEALTLAYRRLGSYRHDVPFKAFLAAVAARQAHTLARSERRRSKREQIAEAPATPDSPEDELRGATAARRIREALSAMPKKRSEAALLRLDGGLSYREIGEALDSTEGSARVLVHTALGQLRELLADLLNDESGQEDPTGASS